MCDEGYELVGSGGACGTELMVVLGSSHCPSNPIQDGKIQMLNENDDDDEYLSTTKLEPFFFLRLEFWSHVTPKYCVISLLKKNSSLL